MRDINVDSVRSVERIIAILNCFRFEQPDLTIDEIVAETGYSKATAYRILWTFEQNGLIHYDKKENKYRLGHKFLEYGGIALQNLDIRREADPILSELHKQLDHNVMMAVRQDDQLQYLLNYECSDGLVANSHVGKKRILHYGALGIVLMSYISEEEVKELLKKHPLEKRTPYTLVDEEQFLNRLEQVRKQGYYVDVDETFVGFTAIAAPVHGLNEEVVGAIGIAGSNFQMEGEERERLIKLVKKAAHRISEKVGMYGKI